MIFLCAAPIVVALFVATLYTATLHKLAGDWTGIQRDIKVNFDKLLDDNYGALINVLFAKEPSDDDPLPAIRLHVEKNAFETLNHDILLHGLGELAAKPKVKGYVEREFGSPQAVWFGFRGSNTWHHQYWKPSLRIRFRKADLMDGYRNHILIAPEDGLGIRNWLTMELARRWGMLNNDEHFVRLFINRRYHGLYTRHWQYDESLLINTGRLPGPFFRLEHGTGPVFKKMVADFETPSMWEIEGVEREEGELILERLIKAVLREPSVEAVAALNQLIDAEAMTDYAALLCHSGEVHVGYHNVALWLDPVSGKMVPLPIDINGYGFENKKNMLRPVLAGTADMIRSWLLDPRNLDAYIARLHDLLTSMGSSENLNALVDEQWRKIRTSAESDLFAGDQGQRNLTFTRTSFPVTKMKEDVERIKEFVSDRIDYLTNQLHWNRVSVISADDSRFELLVEGLSGIVLERRDGRSFVLPSALSVSSGERTRIRLLPTVSSMAEILESPTSYAIHAIPGHPDEYLYRSRWTSEEIALSPPPAKVEEYREKHGLHPLAFSIPDTSELVLGPGRVIFDSDTELAEGRPVTILPGTEVLLGPGVTVIVRGRLLVMGSEDRPVRLRPLIPGRPYGAFAVMGRESAGSEIRHLHCSGGSTGRRLNLSFSGMFSVRDCPSIRISNSVFEKNQTGDDALHIMRGNAVIENCRFANAFRDALDWDVGDGEIRNSTFESNGNDGVDISMARVNISGCTFIRSFDKGVSAGEGSDVRITSSVFRHNRTGVAAKDSSWVRVKDSQFAGNDTAISAFQKKWRWGEGGRVWFSGVRFDSSTVLDIYRGKKSEIISIDGAIPGLVVEGTVDHAGLEEKRWFAMDFES